MRQRALRWNFVLALHLASGFCCRLLDPPQRLRVARNGRHRWLRPGELGGQASRAARFWDRFYSPELRSKEETEWIAAPIAILPFVKEVLHPRPQQILEIGCGDSCLSQELQQSLGGDVRIVAIDISEAALARGRGRLSASPRQVEFVKADATDLGQLFANSSVDVVVDKGLADTLQFRARTRESRDLRQRLFKEVYRVLAPGGLYAMVTPKKQPQYLHVVDWKSVNTTLLPQPNGILFDLASRGDPWATAESSKAYLHLCRKPTSPV